MWISVDFIPFFLSNFFINMQMRAHVRNLVVQMDNMNPMNLMCSISRELYNAYRVCCGVKRNRYKKHME